MQQGVAATGLALERKKLKRQNFKVIQWRLRPAQAVGAHSWKDKVKEGRKIPSGDRCLAWFEHYTVHMCIKALHCDSTGIMFQF